MAALEDGAELHASELVHERRVRFQEIAARERVESIFHQGNGLIEELGDALWWMPHARRHWTRTREEEDQHLELAHRQAKRALKLGPTQPDDRLGRRHTVSCSGRAEVNAPATSSAARQARQVAALRLRLAAAAEPAVVRTRARSSGK